MYIYVCVCEGAVHGGEVSSLQRELEETKQRCAIAQHGMYAVVSFVTDEKIKRCLIENDSLTDELNKLKQRNKECEKDINELREDVRENNKTKNALESVYQDLIKTMRCEVCCFWGFFFSYVKCCLLM